MANEIVERIIDSALSGDNILIPAVDGDLYQVRKIFFVCGDTKVDVIFKDGTDNNLTGLITLNENSAFFLDLDEHPWFTTSYGNAFIINLSTAVQISGRSYYNVQ